MTYLLPAAISVSLALITLLWHGDPKRRRVAGLPDIGHRAALRRTLLAALLLPGLIVAISGDAAAFLVWLGSCAMGGWLVAQLRGRNAG